MPLPDERGFTLLEVMIALAILSLGLTAAFRLQIEDLTVARRAAQTTRACLAAESSFARWQLFGLPEQGPGRAAGGDGIAASSGLSLTWAVKAAEGREGFNAVKIRIQATDGGQWDFERLMMGQDQ